MFVAGCASTGGSDSIPCGSLSTITVSENAKVAEDAREACNVFQRDSGEIQLICHDDVLTEQTARDISTTNAIIEKLCP